MLSKKKVILDFTHGETPVYLGIVVLVEKLG